MDDGVCYVMPLCSGGPSVIITATAGAQLNRVVLVVIWRAEQASTEAELPSGVDFVVWRGCKSQLHGLNRANHLTCGFVTCGIAEASSIRHMFECHLHQTTATHIYVCSSFPQSIACGAEGGATRDVLEGGGLGPKSWCAQKAPTRFSQW